MPCSSSLLQGVPIRLELGPRDLSGQTVVLVRRDSGEKKTVAWADVPTAVPELLENIQVGWSLSVQVCVATVRRQDSSLASLVARLRLLQRWVAG